MQTRLTKSWRQLILFFLFFKIQAKLRELVQSHSRVLTCFSTISHPGTNLYVPMHFPHQEQTEQPISWAPQSTEFDYLCPSSFYWMSGICNIACKQGRLNSRDRWHDRKRISQALKTLTRKGTIEHHSSVAPQLPPLSKPAKTSQKAPPQKALIDVEDLCY